MIEKAIRDKVLKIKDRVKIPPNSIDIGVSYSYKSANDNEWYVIIQRYYLIRRGDEIYVGIAEKNFVFVVSRP